MTPFLLVSVSIFSSLWSAKPADAFLLAKHEINQRRNYNDNSVLSSISQSSRLCVDELLHQVSSDNPARGVIQELIISLSNSTTITNSKHPNQTTTTTDTISSNTATEVDAMFEPLLGYYNVSYTLTIRPNDNPVGGKWTRLWKVRRMLQHILPAVLTSSSQSVAQVVNAIQLDLLWGKIGIWVLLRGDAIPLSRDLANKPPATAGEAQGSQNENKPKISKGNPPLLPNLSERTVRVYFDKPRIGMSLFRLGKQKVAFRRVISLGPTSSVVLDTPYIDDRVRIGRGGISGSQFIFSRLSEEDEDAREGWKWLLTDDSTIATLSRKQLLLGMGVWGVLSSLAYIMLQLRFAKLIAGVSVFTSAIVFAWLAWSTGGIETDGDTFAKGR